MSYSPKNLISIIKKNKDKKIAATRIIETNPKILPVIPKLVTNNTSPIKNSIKDININKSILTSVYQKTKNNKKDNKNILQLFPDIELAMQILVSSILSPKKMTDINLNYRFDKTISLDTTVMSGVLENIKEYVNDIYKLESKLPNILREALFISGAYVTAVIPEASIDEVINSDILSTVSTETFKKKADNLLNTLTRPINIINPSNQISTNDLSIDTNPLNLVKYITSENYVNITDNVNIVRLNKIKDSLRNKIILKSIKTNKAVSLETLEKLDYLDIFRQKKSTTSLGNTEIIKTQKETIRKSIGKPMIIKFPTETVIPVFTPGNEEEHIGYFVLLDETGKPINLDIENTNTERLDSMLSAGIGAQNSPIQKAYKNLINSENNNVNLDSLFELYKDILENQIFTSIKNSLYGENVDISNKNDIYFLMFSRALSDQKTNLLFIPKELVSYIAFNYDETGVGVSLLNNLKILTSLRAILLFSKTMAYAKQSIDVTKVNISLDPNDPDPEKTIEEIQSSVLKLRQNYFPLGMNNPSDLVDWIQKAGLQFSYENNPLIPDVKIDFDNVNLQHTIPDSDLEDELRKQTILALGLSPETIDNGFSPDFATTVVNNNILLSKRVSLYQKTLSEHLNKFLNIIISNDEDLRNILRKYIVKNLDQIKSSLNDNEITLLSESEEHFVEYYVDHLAEHLDVYLPEPDNTNLENLSAEYDLYKDNLEKVIDSVLSTEIFTQDISGNISEEVDYIKDIFKHYLLRKWMSENNYYPEVLDLLKVDDEEIESIMNSITTHLVNVNKNSLDLMSIMKKFKEASNKDLEDIKSEEEPIDL